MDIIKNPPTGLEKESEQVVKEIETAKVNNCTAPKEYEYRRKCTLTQDMIDLLVAQMGHELENYTMYKTFAAYFYRNDLSKLGEYYDLRAKEEDEHHEWIYNYLTECDAEFSYPAVPAINIPITDHVKPFALTVDREIITTTNIYQIANKAAEEGDWLTFNYLMGNDPKLGKLIREQLEEESISRTIYGMAAMENVDWLKKQDSILNFYNNSNE